MGRAIGELHIPGARIVGSAPFALESALRSLTGLLMDTSGVEIGLTVVGVPPHAAVVLWEEASISGQPLASIVPPHEIAALNARLPGLWPPGPYALASAAARVIEAIVNGSRRRFSCFVAAGRGSVGSMPAELMRRRGAARHRAVLTVRRATRGWKIRFINYRRITSLLTNR